MRTQTHVDLEVRPSSLSGQTSYDRVVRLYISETGAGVSPGLQWRAESRLFILNKDSKLLELLVSELTLLAFC